MVNIPTIYTEYIADICGIAELTTGEHADGLKIEHIWMAQSVSAFDYYMLSPCVVVIHSNKWIRGCTTPRIFDQKQQFSIIDLSDISDDVLETLKHNKQLDTENSGLDGYGLAVTYQHEDEFRNLSMWSPRSSLHKPTVDFEQAVNRIMDILDRRKDDAKYVIETEETIRKVDLTNPLTNYTQIKEFARRFGHNGSFNKKYDADPIQYFFLFNMNSASNRALFELPIYSRLSGRYIFLQTQNWLRGMKDWIYPKNWVDLSHLQTNVHKIMDDAPIYSDNSEYTLNATLKLIERYVTREIHVHWASENKELTDLFEPISDWIQAVRSDTG